MLIIFTSIFFLAFIGLLIYGLVAGEAVAFFISMICLGIMLVVGGITLACTYDVIEASYIPEKIEMYETENARIEATTAEIVNSYLESLEGTYARVDAGASVAVISAYPPKSYEATISLILGMISHGYSTQDRCFSTLGGTFSNKSLGFILSLTDIPLFLHKHSNRSYILLAFFLAFALCHYTYYRLGSAFTEKNSAVSV